MTRHASAVLTLAFLLPAGAARAQWGERVQIAPFAGLQYGGSVTGVRGGTFSLDATLTYGLTVDVPFAELWNLELLYSRDETRLQGPGPSVDVRIERYMAGVMEEHDHERTRFFGLALVGATRLVPPAPYSSNAEFTLGLGLGVKHLLAERFGIRAEARGFYTITQANSAIFCSGGCLFLFSGDGLFQGDFTAGLFVAF